MLLIVVMVLSMFPLRHCRLLLCPLEVLKVFADVLSGMVVSFNELLLRLILILIAGPFWELRTLCVTIVLTIVITFFRAVRFEFSGIFCYIFALARTAISWRI